MITPRLRRLLILSTLIILLIYGLVSSTNGELSSLSSSSNESIENIRERIYSYFYEDDNKTKINHITDSKINLGNDLLNKELSSNVKNQRYNKQHQNFYKKIFKMLNEQKFKIPVLELKKKALISDRDFILSYNELQGFLEIDSKQISLLNKLHEDVFKQLPKKFPRGLYKGSGIVLIGGGKFSWLSLLSIKSLRSFGSKLPVELIIPTQEEYEQELCEVILPSLNGKCILLNHVFSDEIMEEIKFSGYQYKSLALIASSFNNVLLLDSDNILVSNPDYLFEKNPFKNHGMILWPDYWRRTTSTFFYEIAGINVTNIRIRDEKWPISSPEEIKDINSVPYHDLKGSLPDLSSESGQLMIRKSDHLKTILLSLFYNLYGPKFFYPLLSQGQSGEGDKDTFIAAAVKSNEDFYQLKTEIQSFGWFEDNNFNGVAMGQRNPIEDYEYYEDFILNGPKLEGSNNNNNKDVPDFKKFNTKSSSIFTVHANFPKLNPIELYEDKKLFNSKNEEIRLYSDISTFLPEPFDFELVQYKRMKSMLCDLKIKLNYFEKINHDEICKFIDNHIEFLKKTPMQN